MNENELLKRIALSIEKGKVSLMSPHPPEMEGEKGTDELMREALDFLNIACKKNKTG
ncbi:MAG: hypothetical protein U9Q97_00580 [Acidobacteriota bacterium]|nr:hypothetical protein [Acidobacteriota bacterium]